MNALPAFAVCTPLVACGLLVAIFARMSGRAVAIAATLAGMTTLFLCIGVLVDVARNGSRVLWFGGWHPGNVVGLGIVFVVDPGGAAVATCIAAVLTGCVLFSREYFDEVGAIFYVLVLAMLGAMIAFAYAGDAFDLFVFYEVFSVAAYALSAYRVELKSAYQGAFQFALVNSVAGLFVLAGIILLEGITGQLGLASIGRSLPAQHPAPIFLAISFAFVTIGLFTRGAFAPLHYWFDEVHASAPTPLCVILSSTMVPLALFGYVRLYLVAFSAALPPNAGPASVLCAFGSISAIVGSAMCLRETKLKRMLAFATIAHIGVAALAISSFTAAAFAGAALFFGGYAFAVAALFMAVAAVRSVTGTAVDLFGSAGAGRRLYVSGAVFALATCEMVDLWPSARAVLWGSDGWRADLILALYLIVAAATGGASLRAFVTIFFEERSRSARGRNVPWFMLVPAVTFALVPLVVSLIPAVSEFALRAGDEALDVSRYRTLAFGGALAPSTPIPIPAAMPIAWLGFLSAAVGGYVCLGRARTIRLLRIAAGRNGAIAALARLHAGDVGGYVAWVVGCVTLATAAVLATQSR